MAGKVSKYYFVVSLLLLDLQGDWLLRHDLNSSILFSELEIPYIRSGA